MKANSISLGQLLDKGYQITMKDMNLNIENNENQLITKVEMTKNRMFQLNLNCAFLKCL